jgi:hypothetical protein
MSEPDTGICIFLVTSQRRPARLLGIEDAQLSPEAGRNFM